MNSTSKPSLRVWVKPSATFPHFAQPTAVSYFSLDQDRRFAADTSQLRYMYLPRDSEDLSWDLNHGIDGVQRSDHAKSIERIDNLLRGILASGLAVNPEVASIMCLRGLLTRVMTTPYEQNQGWEILVSKFRDVLFMCAQETPEQRRERMSQDERQKRFSSWGFKFEQYMTTDQPGCPPDIDMPVKEGEEFCCLFRTKLNDRRLIYGAEMDAVTSDVPLEDCLEDLMLAEFIELKTSRKLTCVRQERNFKRFKLLNWWAQNFLVNVAHIICGFRDDNGVVEKIAFYKVAEIPKMARDLWVPAVCMTFLDQFLSFVVKTVQDCPQSNDPNTVWRFRWEPGVHYVTGDVISGKSQFSFLPDWFMSSVKAMESHPLDCCIRIYSSRHGGNSGKDNQHMHTAKVLDMAKAIALQRAKSKRPPSPKTIMLAQRSSKTSVNQLANPSIQSTTVTEPSSSNSHSNPSTSAAGFINTPTSPHMKANAAPSSVCEPSSSPASEIKTLPQVNSFGGPIRSQTQSRRQRRRARDRRSSPVYPSSSQRKPYDRGDHPSSRSSNKSKSVSAPSLPVVKKLNDPSDYDSSGPHRTSKLSLSISSDHYIASSSQQSSFSPTDMPPSSLQHQDEIVYSSPYNSLEDNSFLHSSSGLSPPSSMDQFTSQTFLTSSPPDDSFTHHTLMPSSLTSSSLIGDCYSSHSFSACDDLPQSSYLVPSNVDFIHQDSFLQQSTIPMTQRSYLSSPGPSEYIDQPSFMPVESPDDIHSPHAYLTDASEKAPSSPTLLPLTTISHSFLSSSNDITEEIQTAEGSLSTINQLSSAAY